MRVRVSGRWAAAAAVAGLMASTVAPSAAGAQQPLQMAATLNRLQEVPPTTSPATGFGTILWNAGAGTLNVTLSFAGLTSPTAGVGPGGAPAHVHAAAPGANGPIVIPLIGVPVGATAFAGYARTFTFAELGTIGVNATNLTLLQNALNAASTASPGTPANLYFNIHTQAFPGGEIRGDIAVVPEPSTYLLLATGVGALGLIARRRRAS